MKQFLAILKKEIFNVWDIAENTKQDKIFQRIIKLIEEQEKKGNSI